MTLRNIWKKKRVVTHKLNKGGKRKDLDGRYFRSSWEANFARICNWWVKHKVIDKWEYETEEYEFPVKRGQRFYRIDFKTFSGEKIARYEIKGWMGPASRTKLRRLKKHYPEIYATLRIVNAVAYRRLSNYYGRILPGWESERKTNDCRI